MKTILQAKHVQKDFEGTNVLNDVCISIAEGEFIAVMGQSGCGKSTLLYNLSGMDQPSAGTVRFGGQDIQTLGEAEMSKVRLRKMGFVFQKANLLKALSIRDNIVFPAYQAAMVPREEINENAEKWLEKTGILHVADHDIRRVSGGQMQRASICRALMNSPEILFADEPTGALNSSATKEIMDIFNQINREGTAILLVTHDGRVAARADRIIYLEDGTIRDELLLGKYNTSKREEREHKMAKWLDKMEF